MRIFRTLASAVATLVVSTATAATLRTPGQFATVQAAIDAANAGDAVVVAPGTYRERLKLRPGILVKSDGDDSRGKLGLRRAETTTLDGAGGAGPGVQMAPGATLDGFTVTGVGEYDDALWQREYSARGDGQRRENIGRPGTAGIAVNDNCNVLNNIVHHIGYTGIAITGAPGREVAPRIAGNACYRNMGGGIGSMAGSAGIIENNTCIENFHAGIGHSGASPVVRGNVCHGNIRAGIGISDGASPKVTGNRCFNNRRAGIGIRTGKATQPVVEDNECFENGMAGIGVKEDAEPLIRGNRCRDNRLAGIGVEGGASAKLIDNSCTTNKASGIGLRDGAHAEIARNKIIDNALVAIGVTGRSQATITENELARKGGAPPMIAVLDDSHAVVTGNSIRGSGVSGILVKGRAEIRGNRFVGGHSRANSPSNFAVWVQKGSEITFIGNHVGRWRHALSATGAVKVTVKDNEVLSFTGTAIVIRDAKEPAEVTGNRGVSDDPGAKLVEVAGAVGRVSGNELKPAAAKR